MFFFHKNFSLWFITKSGTISENYRTDDFLFVQTNLNPKVNWSYFKMKIIDFSEVIQQMQLNDKYTIQTGRHDG